MRWVKTVTGQRWVRADQVIEVHASMEREPSVLLSTPPGVGSLVFARFPLGTETEEVVRCAELLIDELVLEDPTQPVVPAVITAEDCGG